MNKLAITILLISTIGLFSFSNQSATKIEASHGSMLGMVLLEEVNSLDIEKVVSDLENKWKVTIDEKEVSDEATVLKIDNYNIAIATIPMPIPGDEVAETAAYNYLWENGAKEAAKHKGHVLVTILNAGHDAVKENILFNQIAASVLENSKSLGIYIGERTLLLEKDFYLANTEGMTAEDLPLYNWIYFGLRQEKGKQSIYTYGLADFGKQEMEIVNTKKSFDELSELMFNMSHYVIAYDVVLKDGETIGMTATQKLKIKESKGKFLAGKTLKIGL